MRGDAQKAMLRVLADKEEHPAYELDAACGWRFGATLFALRAKGYIINTINKGQRRYSYQLIKEPS